MPTNLSECGVSRHDLSSVGIGNLGYLVRELGCATPLHQKANRAIEAEALTQPEAVRKTVASTVPASATLWILPSAVLHAIRSPFLCAWLNWLPYSEIVKHRVLTSQFDTRRIMFESCLKYLSAAGTVCNVLYAV